MIGEVDTPRTVFYYIKRLNRTEKGKIGDHKSREGEEEALKILNIADVTSAIPASGTTVPMSKHVPNCTET